MRQWWPRLLILLLLAVIVGVPVALSSSREDQAVVAEAPSTNRLIIMTPHNQQIRHEFGRAFNQWRKVQGLSGVYFDWRSPGGTTDQRKQIIDAFEAAIREGREDGGIGYDLFFGGGEFEHNKLANGIKAVRGGKTVSIALSVPVELSDKGLLTIFPSPQIGGELLYHPQLRWVGAALSSFGIVYNQDVLDRLNLPQPRTWSDLTDPRYARWIALADPAHSGSIAATYDAILRRRGWDEGWRMLRQVFANSRYFTASAGKVPVDVSAGEAAAGMCIDFYGRFQAGSIADQRVGYVDPPFMTAITSDPISILRGAPHLELAQQFVTWLLSAEAQCLWQRRRGAPGGPELFELRRLPIRRDVYHSDEMAQWTDQVQPFEIAKPFASGTPSFYNLVAPLSHAMAIDVHDDLVRAWAVLCEQTNHPRFSEMVDLFERMPPDLSLPWPEHRMSRDWQLILADAAHPQHQEVVKILKDFAAKLEAGLKDKDQHLADRLRWTLFFRDNYRQVVRMAREP